jgi:hypothetical protein
LELRRRCLFETSSEEDMKRILTAGGLAAVLIFAGACSTSTAPANSTTNTAANANANKPAQTTNTANTPAANTSNTASSNTASSSSNEGGEQDFTLINSTGVVINKLFISPHDKDDWEEDILGQDTLPSGKSLDIKFNRDEKADMWDLRVEDTQGNAIEWENLKLTEISKVTLHYENGKATAETE